MKFRIVASLLVILVLVTLYVVFQPSSGDSASSSVPQTQEPQQSYSGLGK